MHREKLLRFAGKISQSQVSLNEEELNKLSEHQLITNDANLRLFRSKVTARSAAFTSYYGASDEELINQVLEMAEPDDFLVSKLQVCTSEEVKISATFISQKKYANVPLMLSQNFVLREEGSDLAGDVMTFYFPDFPERKVIIDRNSCITYVLGIDYYGEAKMSILRMAMEIMRSKRGGLGVHAGSKTISVKSGDGIKTVGLLIFGLSGTGKTTLTCHNHGLSGEESVNILQDDINLITKDGKTYGTEIGFYIKCDAIPHHKLLTKAVLSPESILENVHVDGEQKINWENFIHTRNTRAIVSRASLRHTSDRIDLPNLDFILYNTRRPELPPIGRLRSPEQSAAYYGLGESIVTSAENPDKIGEARRVVGFDPFIIDDHAGNINRLADILKQQPQVQSFVLNTGFIGNEENDISVNDTSQLILSMVRGEVEWKFDPDLSYEVPEKISGIDLEKLSPRKYYGSEEYKLRMKKLREERITHLEKFRNVRKGIIATL